MKILLISHEYPPIGGGGANACYNIAKEYVMSGNSVTLVTSSFRELRGVYFENNIKIIRVPAIRKKEDTSTLIEMCSFLSSAFYRINKIIKLETFDCCHIFFGVPSGIIGLYLKKFYNIPYIVRLGGGDIPGAQKRFNMVYKILSPLLLKIWKEANYLIANSQGLRNRAFIFSKAYPISIIPNGVDCSVYCQKEKVVDKNAVNILFVSRLIEGKGLQYIIPLLNKLQYVAKKNIRLTVVGDGPYRKNLEELGSKQNVNELIEFLGRRTKKELIEIYNRADFFILPSSSEGMPNVVLEAMAMGLPIVITPCEGSEELIKDNGFITPIDRFYDRMLELCNNDELRKTYSKESRARVKKYFSWKKVAKEYLTLLNNIGNT